MYSRPKPGETEDDLFRLQEEFFKQKSDNSITPAAKVISEKQENPNSLDETTKTDIEEQLANTFEAVPNDINIGKVVEKKGEIQTSKFKFNISRGFPLAKRREAGAAPTAGSIFSQHIKKLKTDESRMDVDPNPPKITFKKNTLGPSDNAKSLDKHIIKLPQQSYIVEGQDSEQIHEENVSILKNMSEEEIIEERNKLIDTMDPAIVAFLKSRRKRDVIQTRNLTIKEQNEAAKSYGVEEIEAPSDILKQPESEKWLNFDVVESNKLAWMRDIEIPKVDKDKQYEARFNFEGWLLPFSQTEINEQNRILYHHGDDPGRPGYTLQELFQLARSSIVQQKIIALNCIANILSLQSTGIYNHIIDIPIEQVFFVVRICLDENTPAVLNSSVKAMRNLIFNQIDDVCLDGLLGFGVGCIQPTLAIDNDPEDDNTVNDQQLAETNIVKCLVRTDILIRIRYILFTVKPALETVVYCFQILIRLARDSQFIFNKITSCDGLIENILTYFLPKVYTPKNDESCYGYPLVQAVKFLRVLVSRNKTQAEQLLKKYKIMESIMLYLSSDTYSANANGLMLQMECMHFWSALVCYNLALDYFSVLEPVLIKLLEYHVNNTNLDNQTTFVRNGNIAALFILLGNVGYQKFAFIRPFTNLIFNQCLFKWSSQFRQLTAYSCGKLQIISSLYNCIAAIKKVCPDNNQFYEQTDEILISLIKSEGFNIVTLNVLNGSMLLNNFETYTPSTNLKSIQGAAWDSADHVVPVLQTRSCIPFLYNISQYMQVTDNYKLKLLFLQHTNIKKYLESLQKLDQYYLTGNWFTRTESFFVINLLKISVSVQKYVDTSIFYELAVKSLCIFNSEQKEDIEYVLKNIVFCQQFYPSEILMRNLDITQRTNSLEVSLNNLAEIRDVYTQVLGLKINIPNFSTSLCLDINIGSVIPIDWIYTPIIVLYSNQQQNKNVVSEEQQVYIIKNCLRWILIYETYFPLLAVSINPTDRFCRLACVFLGSDSLFLNQEIHMLLELCFKNVMKFEKELNFKKEIQGLSNFHDFFTQLLDQYQGVSYGDILFGNIIIVPLAQKHLKQYKKTLWSEYMGAVQICNVTPEKMISSLDMYLNPPEEDMTLIKSYQSALISGNVRKNSALYEIASFHVKQFINRTKNT